MTTAQRALVPLEGNGRRGAEAGGLLMMNNKHKYTVAGLSCLWLCCACVTLCAGYAVDLFKALASSSVFIALAMMLM